MRICIHTPVSQSYDKVFSGLNKNLFLKLMPAFPPSKVARFDGNMPGDEVHIVLSFLVFTQEWVSEITENQITDTQAWFIDSGRRLPFFLSKWKHTHKVKSAQKGSVLVDDIEFSTPMWIPSILVYPVLYQMFKSRKKVYQKVFGKI